MLEAARLKLPGVWLQRALLALAAIVAAALGAFACQTAPPGAPTIQALQAASTKAALRELSGHDPARCAWSRPGFEICVWQFGDRDLAWHALASAIGTSWPVNHLCELPADGSLAAQPCVTLPRHAPLNRTSRGHRYSRSRDAAQRSLDAATTVWQISRLVGDAPEFCSEAQASERTCVWESSRYSAGYNDLVRLIDDRVRLQIGCTLPADGSPRAPGSCRVSPR